MAISNFFKKIKERRKRLKKVIELEHKVLDRLVELEYHIKNSYVEKRLEARRCVLEKHFSQEVILTIFMPTYNGERYIARALESILMQETTYTYKILVIDDCSTDNTVKIVEEYQNLYPHIIDIEINKQNEGGKSMAPKIFNKVKTKYWMNFDQDDFWLSKDKMQRSLDFFEKHPDYTLCSANVIVRASNKLSLSYQGAESSIKIEFKDYPYPLGILLQTSSTMFRNVFTDEDLKHINSYVGTQKEYCILGDTFRNIFALSKGKGYYENSIDSVYNWTETGVWSSLNIGQQHFYNLQYFYGSIDFFKDETFSKHIKEIAKRLLKDTKINAHLLNKEELAEFNDIEKGLQSNENTI